MTVYVLCFDPPYETITETGRIQTARHYIGFTPDRDPSRRINDHLSCGPRANPLVKAVIQGGGTVHTVKVWKCGNRSFERYLKASGHVMRWCPRCGNGRSPPTFAGWVRRGSPTPPTRRRKAALLADAPPPWKPTADYYHEDEQEIPF